MPKAIQPLTAKQELFTRMSARGESRPDILREVFGLDVATSPENAIHAADAKMHRWRQHPDFDRVWKEEVRSVIVACTSEAIKVVKEQMRDKKVPWLQNKAANDILSYGKTQIFGDEEKQITVKVEGMPDIGSPDEA
jgi:hypothetical protein